MGPCEGNGGGGDDVADLEAGRELDDCVGAKLGKQTGEIGGGGVADDRISGEIVGEEQGGGCGRGEVEQVDGGDAIGWHGRGLDSGWGWVWGWWWYGRFNGGWQMPKCGGVVGDGDD